MSDLDILNVDYWWLLIVVLPLLFWKMIQYVCSNSVALSGIAIHPYHDSCSDHPRPNTTFVLRVQNLESIPLDHPITVRISAFLTSDEETTLPHQFVKIQAGAKAFSEAIDFHGSRLVWTAETDHLPAFDTWTFECQLPAEQVSFEVLTSGQESRNVLKVFVTPDISPTKLVVYKADIRRARLEGPTVVPKLVLPIMASLMAVSIHILWIGFSALGTQMNAQTLAPVDGWAMLLEVIAIWIAYLLIRRPVLPVVSGYRKQTNVHNRPSHSKRTIDSDARNESPTSGT